MSDMIDRRRRRLLRGAALLMTGAWVESGRAEYPTRPVLWIVPGGAGGAADTFARMLQAPAQEALGAPLVIDNRVGAGGIVGSREVVRAAPDGYTLLIGSLGTNVIAPLVTPSYNIDIVRDFTPVTKLVNDAGIILGAPGLPVDDLAGLLALALARSAPAPLQFGTPGVGTSGHLIAELLALRTGVKLQQVPYKTTAQAYVDLMADRLQLVFAFVAGVQGYVRSGRMKALAVTTAKRVSALPQVPTVEEGGVPDFDIATWYGVLAPSLTPAPIVARIHQAMTYALRTPEVLLRLADAGAEPVGNAPAEFAAQIRADVERWAAVVKAAGIRVQ
jgi:tripartite-type tricarboxylate transporter receptor subunit TctC